MFVILDTFIDLCALVAFVTICNIPFCACERAFTYMPVCLCATYTYFEVNSLCKLFCKITNKSTITVNL